MTEEEDPGFPLTGNLSPAIYAPTQDWNGFEKLSPQNQSHYDDTWPSTSHKVNPIPMKPSEATSLNAKPKAFREYDKHNSDSKHDRPKREERHHRHHRHDHDKEERHHDRHHDHHRHHKRHHREDHDHDHNHDNTKRDKRSRSKSRSKSTKDHHKRSSRSSKKEDHDTRLKEVYQKGFVPSPEFLPEFSPYYMRLDAYVEITACRGSGKTTLVKEILSKRAKEFFLILTFSSTEKLNGAMSEHNAPAFSHHQVDTDMLENLLNMREQQIDLLENLRRTMERSQQSKRRPKEYKEICETLARRRKQYICLFFDDMTSSHSTLNNSTFTRLRNMGRHYSVCVIINKQSDQNVARHQRNQADTSIMFAMDDTEELKRTWSTQFQDLRLFPTFDDFKRAHHKYCSLKRGGCLIRMKRFDPRIPNYIKQFYTSFAYQTKDLSTDEIGSFANHRVQLYNDAVYAPHELVNEYAKQRELTQQYDAQLENINGKHIPRGISMPPPPPSSTDADTAGKRTQSKKGTKNDKTEPPVSNAPVRTRPGKVRLRMDPTGETFWNASPTTNMKR